MPLFLVQLARLSRETKTVEVCANDVDSIDLSDVYFDHADEEGWEPDVDWGVEEGTHVVCDLVRRFEVKVGIACGEPGDAWKYVIVTVETHDAHLNEEEIGRMALTKAEKILEDEPRGYIRHLWVMEIDEDHSKEKQDA